jgi:E3 ubiquitin-protein ligase DOA10
MSIRKAGGDWEPMLLGIEPRTCRVCGKGLYRNVTLFRGGWSRCTVCDQFVHYSCLASGKTSFLKARPRVCKVCREEPARASIKEAARLSSEGAELAVGS